MSDSYDEDEDWVGEPPEGRYSRDRADPGFWLDHRPVSLVAGAVAVVVVILLLILLL